MGNLTTPALSDSKCVLYAVSLPALLRGMLPEIQMPLIDLIVATAVENLKPGQLVSTLDFDLLISADERVTNTTYVQLLTSLCQEWSHQILQIEDELEMEEEQLVLVSKLFTRQDCN